MDAAGAAHPRRRGAADATRRRSDVLLEIALLRRQLLVPGRAAKRLRRTAADRGLLIILAGRLRTWADAPVIVRPETVLRRHRQGFRRFWRRKSRAATCTARLAHETIALIRQPGRQNPLWGADRIRGELPKLGIRVSKRTIQRYLRQASPPRRSGQAWSTFLRNHAGEIWACDFLPVSDLLFRPLYAFFVVTLGSRRVMHVGVTRHPTDAWVAQQLRAATPFDERPRFRIRDNDRTYGRACAGVAATSGITALRTAFRAPRQNAICERFLGRVRRECLDHVLVLGEGHLRRILREYARYSNHDRPHQGLARRILTGAEDGAACAATGGVRALPVLGGLHHAYARAA
jgi:transposase InsO family protein